MIPTVIFVGLIAGLALPRTQWVVIGSAFAALGWGVVVAGQGASVFVGGALLAMPNYAVGAVYGVFQRRLTIAAIGSRRHRQAG